MMAFGVVVIAALVGSPGLGQSVLNGLEKIDVGLALDAGLAIVLVAVILDRISSGRNLAERRAHARRDPVAQKRRELLIGLGHRRRGRRRRRLAEPEQFPEGVDVLVAGAGQRRRSRWLQENVRNGVPVIGGYVGHQRLPGVRMLEPLRQLLADTPWWIVTAAIGTLAWFTAGRRVAIVSVAASWPSAGCSSGSEAMDTLSQVLVAVVLAVVIAVPIGILAGRSDTVDRALRPILDAAQVLPAFVYLIPVIVLFNVGRVPGLVASVIYAIPVGIRLTSLGIRQVPAETVEAAVAYGATPRQVLWKVQVPLARAQHHARRQPGDHDEPLDGHHGRSGRVGRLGAGRGEGPHEEPVRVGDRPGGRDLHRAVGGRARPHHPGLGPASPGRPRPSVDHKGETEMRNRRELEVRPGGRRSRCRWWPRPAGATRRWQ